VPPELLRELVRHDRYLVLGHVEPDGDCIASELLLEAILRRLGKRVSLYNEGPFLRPEVRRHAARFAASIPPAELEGDAMAVVVDCSTPERVGGLSDAIRGVPTAVIDHHSSGRAFGDVRLIDPSAPSVALMLLGVMDALGMEPVVEEAELVLFGLCTDTAFFRHLGGTSAPVFRSVARLIEIGASPQATYLRIYGGRRLEERRLIGLTLWRTESLHGGRLLVCTQTVEDKRSAGDAEGGSDEIYRLLQTVDGAEIVVLIRQEAGTEHSVGLRSAGPIDVGAVATLLGGGGHAPAAGCTVHGPLEDVRRRVLEALAPLLDPSSAQRKPT
jgi:phosphoesterase RecJ-like protein